MLTLNDGRSELWQWDTNRKLTVDAECSQVHFSNKVFGRSIDVDVVDGVATIPDILLQTDKDLNVWAFVGTAENGYTKISKAFKVNRRNKPADYVFTPHDQTTLGEIVQRLEELEAMQDPDAIRDAVDEYLAKNPIKVEETDPTVPDWAKQPEPPKVEIPEINIPTTLPNPNALTFKGAVTGSYDGSEPMTVEIPEGGAGGESKLTTLIDETLKEAVANIDYDFGKAYRYLEVYCYTPKAIGNTTNNNPIMLNPNNKQGRQFLVGSISLYGSAIVYTEIKVHADGITFIGVNNTLANVGSKITPEFSDGIQTIHLIPKTAGETDLIPIETHIVIKGREEL